MPFEKGHKKYKGAGLKKGDKIKKTLEWEQFGREILEAGLPRAKKVMEESGDKDFMFYFNQLLEYFKPKLQRTEVINDNPPTEVNISLNLDRDLSNEK